METKIVYILTSSEKDYYLEQTMISACSLKMHNPDCYAILVVDQTTNQQMQGNRRNILKFFDELKIVAVPEKFNQVQSSRYIKTSLRSYIEGDYLFIDGDTVICDDLSEIDQTNGNLCCVLDRHLKLNAHQHVNDILKWAKMIEWIPSENYFNSGVFFVRESYIADAFYNQWHNEWLENYANGFPRDQPSMCKSNNSMGNVISELSPKWNCQIIENGLCFLNQAKIIHYFSSNNSAFNPCPYLLANKKIYLEIRKNDYIISKNIIEMLERAKFLFIDKTLILGGEDTYFFDNPIVRFLKTVYYSHPTLFRRIQKTAEFLKHPFRKIN